MGAQILLWSTAAHWVSGLFLSPSLEISGKGLRAVFTGNERSEGREPGPGQDLGTGREDCEGAHTSALPWRGSNAAPAANAQVLGTVWGSVPVAQSLAEHPERPCSGRETALEGGHCAGTHDPPRFTCCHMDGSRASGLRAVVTFVRG